LKVESKLKIVEGVEEFREDDLDAGTRLLVESPPSGKGKGKELFNKLKNFRDQLMAIDPDLAKEIGPTLPVDLRTPKTNQEPKTDKEIEQWAFNYFHMTPSVAGLTMLSKFQNDIKNSEAQAVEFCHKEIGEVELIYDEFKALAQPSTQYAMPGEQIIITAGLGAFNKAARPVITVDGANVPLNPDGAAEYKMTAGAAGAYSKKVTISYTKPDGTIARVDKEVKYTVGVPSGLVVSTDKTRVFYQGLDNPLSITGGGGDEKVNLTVEGPGVKSSKAGPGQYIVNCEQLGTAIVTASDGKNNQKISIPIKKVPNPLATVGGKYGGGIAANVFRVQRGVAAELRDFVFEGVRYDVISYTIYFTGKGFEENIGFADCTAGSYFTPEAVALIKRCQPGTTVVIDEIKVKGPGGTRTLDQNISFTLQ
jgi:gliding motility-associated protein GldM